MAFVFLDSKRPKREVEQAPASNEPFLNIILFLVEQFF